MRKIWTRLATLALILVVTISFSACSLFTVNLDKKYSPNVMVATAANDDLSVSRKELYYGYLEWGYQYASYMSETELLEYITSALMNNKILEKESIEKFGALREEEEAYARKLAFQSLNKSLRAYVYEALDMDDPEAKEEETDDSTEVDQAYKPSIITSYENGERVFMMDLSGYADEEGNGLLSLDEYRYFKPSVPGVASQKNIKQALAKVIRNLQTFESGYTKLKAPETDYLDRDEDGIYSDYFKSLSRDERNVLNREIDRMVQSNMTSILVERIDTAYNLGFTTLSKSDAKKAWDDYLARGKDFAAWCDAINGVGSEKGQPAYFGCGREVATIVANNAIEYYIGKTANAINNQKNFPDTDIESTLMSSGLADVYYVPTEVANNLFTVSHILIGFTDEQKTEYERIQTEAAQNLSYNPQNDLNKLYAETKSNGVSASDVLIEVQTALGKADSAQDKYRIFREYINQYNSDPGMQNLEQLNSNSKPQYEYLMSGTADNNNMVEAFTTASIKLFDQGVKGAISGLVWTEYGAHIIMYTRDIADFIFTGAAGMETDSIELLKMNYADTLFATTTSYGTRTLFDTMVDAYFTRNSDNYRYSLLADYKHDHQITIVTSEFKSFFN